MFWSLSYSKVWRGVGKKTIVSKTYHARAFVRASTDLPLAVEKAAQFLNSTEQDKVI